jgi:LemA protein
MLLWIILLIAAAVGIYIIAIFNRLVRTRQMANEAWSGIDVQLKRRSDLVPNLVETVKGYAAHERSVLEEVTELRGAARALPSDHVARRAQAEGALSAALGRLFALAENYPDLKASGNFLELQQQLSDLENEIQMARRYYNGAVRNLNVLVQSFPSNLIAGTLGFNQREYFEVSDAADRAVPEVALQPAPPAR